ncbi:MAG: DUF296 domain-containing protein [Desulfurococcales archaeon]|nr:DUF296 domain-containing protein [Desulfurococcales archaeon]
MASGKALLSRGRVLFLRLDDGFRLPQAIDSELEKQGIKFASIKGIGGIRWARIAVFSPAEKKYYPVDLEAEPGMTMEMTSLLGNSVLGPDNTYYTHLHIVLARKPGEVYSGHLIEAEIHPLAEIFIEENIGSLGDVQRLLSNRWSQW